MSIKDKIKQKALEQIRARDGYEQLLDYVLEGYEEPKDDNSKLKHRDIPHSRVSQRLIINSPMRMPTWRLPEYYLTQAKRDQRRLINNAQKGLARYEERLSGVSPEERQKAFDDLRNREANGIASFYLQPRNEEEKALSNFYENVNYYNYYKHALERYTQPISENLADYPDEAAKTPAHKRQYFTKQQTPRVFLNKLYRLIRGNATLSPTKDLLGMVPSQYLTAQEKNQMHRAAKDNVIQYDIRTGALRMPAAIVKKIDPQYKDYLKDRDALYGVDIPAYYDLDGHMHDENGIREAIAEAERRRDNILDSFYADNPDYEGDPFDHPDFPEDAYNDLDIPEEPVIERFGSDNAAQRARLGFLLSRNGLRNLARSTNKVRALADVNQWIEDQGQQYFTKGVAASPDADSLNDLERIRDLINRRKHSKDKDLDWDAPFQYSNDVQTNVPAGFHLATTPNELYQVTCKDNICVGKKEFGFIDGVLNKKKLILRDDDNRLTAEIRLEHGTGKDKNKITNAYVAQLKGPNNEDLTKEGSGPRKKIFDKANNTLQAYAASLKGKSLEITEPEDIDEELPAEDPQEVCDIITKHINGTTTQDNIMNALRQSAVGFKDTVVEPIINAQAGKELKTDTGKQGNALGKIQNPNKRYLNLVEQIKSLRY